jgi:hypothetical protein
LLFEDGIYILNPIAGVLSKQAIQLLYPPWFSPEIHPMVQGFFCKFEQVLPLKKKEQINLNLEMSNMFCWSATHR